MWKRCLCALLLCACLMTGVAGAQSLPAEDAWALEQAQALAQHMQALAKDEQYVRMFATNEALLEKVEPLKQADWARPLGQTVAVLPPRERINDLLTALSEDTVLYSALAIDEIYRRMPAALVSGVAGTQGVEWLVVSNILAVSRSYPAPEGFAPCVVALEAGDYAVLVSFGWGGEGIVTGQAVFVGGQALEAFDALIAAREAEEGETETETEPLFVVRVY